MRVGFYFIQLEWTRGDNTSSLYAYHMYIGTEFFCIQIVYVMGIYWSIYRKDDIFYEDFKHTHKKKRRFCTYQ